MQNTNWEQLFGSVGMVGIIVVGGFLLVLSVTWLLLPFILVGKLNEIIRRLNAIESNSDAIAKNTRREGDKPQSSSVRYIPGING